MDLQNLVLPAFLAMTVTIFQEVQLHVTKPFIDEIFHLRQCSVYCAHKFTEWDNKITTPPGLYLLGTAYHHILQLFGLPDSCGYTALRSLNLVGGVLALPAVLSLVPTTNFWKINVVSLPLLYTYYFLFYTDVWLTVLVALSITTVIKYPSFKGALLSNLAGFLSLWFRQTNIIWIAFAACILVERRKKQSKKGVIGEVTAFTTQLLSDWSLMVPYILSALLFAAFIKINGGITFGDKENHKVSIHFVQVFYCAAFLTFFTVPLWLSVATLKQYVKFSVTNNYGANALITGVSFLAINYTIKHFTVVHPFLLADNRHYTFYIYRRILSQKYANLVVVPVYHFSSWVVSHLLSTNASAISLGPTSILAFIGASAITLIPSPLFEPRYYIVPLLVLRFFSGPNKQLPATKSHLFEFLWFLFINTVVFIVFFTYEFHWWSEEGVQRIIW